MLGKRVNFVVRRWILWHFVSLFVCLMGGVVNEVEPRVELLFWAVFKYVLFLLTRSCGRKCGMLESKMLGKQMNFAVCRCILLAFLAVFLRGCLFQEGLSEAFTRSSFLSDWMKHSVLLNVCVQFFPIVVQLIYTSTIYRADSVFPLYRS